MSSTVPAGSHGPLLLLGSSDAEASVFEAASATGARWSFLPTAAAFEPWEPLAEQLASVLAKVGVELVVVPVVNREGASDAANVAALQGAGGIVIAGESAMHARSVLSGTPVWTAVHEAWSAGAAMVGVGGAAALFGDPMVDPRGGAFTLGLGVLAGLAVLPHGDTWSADRMKRTLKMAAGKHALLMIPEQGWAGWNGTEGWTAHAGVGIIAKDAASPLALADLPIP
jgi:cyanophycinase